MENSNSKDHHQGKGNDLPSFTDNQTNKYERRDQSTRQDDQSTREESGKLSCSLDEVDRESVPQSAADCQQGGEAYVNASDGKMEMDPNISAGNHYSHAVKEDNVMISVRGNLKIIDETQDNNVCKNGKPSSDISGHDVNQEALTADASTESDVSKDQYHRNTSPEPTDTWKVTENTENANGPQFQNGDNWNENDAVCAEEKKKALEGLRKGKTYEEEEDYETFEDDAIDIESYNRAREKYVYFWKSYDIYSQWHSSEFFVDNQKFRNAEQFMMYRKAVLFGDDEIGSEILGCKNPRKIKALGREVRGFDPDVWQQYCLYIVKEGNRAKFLHNDELLGELLLTYPKVLVEASPLDKIWGIGLDEYSPEAWDEETWKGTNYLGYVLTELRDDLMVERGMIDEQDRERYIDQLLTDAGYPVDNRHTEQEQGAEGETYLLFSHGIYSQWHKSRFDVDKMTFCCAEQYMMFKKAELFNDEEIAKEILRIGDPKQMKQLGRKVKGFSEEIWQKHCLLFVKQGNIAKFSQNKRLKKAIVTTYPKVLVEANPNDKIWGIGLKKEDTRSQNKHTWHGKNFLGYLLTEVRDELMCQLGLIKEERKKIYIDKLKGDWNTPVHDGVHQKHKTAVGKHFPHNPDHSEKYNKAVNDRKHSPSKTEDYYKHQGANNRHGEHEVSTRSGNKQGRNDDHYRGRGVDQNTYKTDQQAHGYDHKKHSNDHNTHDKHHNTHSQDHKAQSLETGDEKKRQQNRNKSTGSDMPEVSPVNEEGWQQIEGKKGREKNAKTVQNVPESDRAGKGPVTHAERGKKHTTQNKQSGHENKMDRNTDKQKEIVEDFDIDVVMAAYSKEDHEETVQSSPSKKKGKGKGAQHETGGSEKVHKTDKKESTPEQGKSRRQRKNLKKQK